ncbi:DUF6226 family protein [Saccharomonospora sp.]|uniref:DUF6226 family protein n=1 Tax=Saccharomonospora sp. TaxID=33913 RepID=UPI002611206C|nr:DUF6226 family protein [Saccharomonospora sp.]
MPTIDELRTRVEHSYERLRMPSWPDPHPDMASPRDEEYSRVTEPGRYDIVHARARVWAEKLSEVPGVELERFTPTAAGRQDRDRFDRGFRITSSTPGTLPLLLLEQNASDDEPTVPSLRISVVRPDFEVERVPDCGCDACDFGSANFLESIDETIGAVVGGPFVMLRGKGWNAHWYPEGSAMSGRSLPFNHVELRELCRRLVDGEDVRLPRGTESFVGHSWLT